MPTAGRAAGGAGAAHELVEVGSTDGDGPLDVLQPHEAVAVGPCCVERQRQHGVDGVQGRHPQARHGGRHAAPQHGVRVERVRPPILGRVVEVPVEVDADAAARHADLAGHHRLGQGPVVNGVVVAVLLQHPDGGGVVLAGDEEVEVGVGPVTDVRVEAGHHRPLHHQPGQSGVIEGASQLTQRADDDEVVERRHLPGLRQRRQDARSHDVGDALQAALHRAADAVQRRCRRQGGGRRCGGEVTQTPIVARGDGRRRRRG